MHAARNTQAKVALPFYNLAVSHASIRALTLIGFSYWHLNKTIFTEQVPLMPR